MTMQGGTARDRLRARAQAMYGGKRREDEEQQNRQNQRQEVETPAVGSARDRLRQRASTMGVVTGQRENAQEPTQERSRLTAEGYEAAIKGMQERMGGQTGLTKSGIVRHTQSRETEKWRQEQAKKYSGLRDQADYAKKSTKVDQSLASGKGAYIFGHYVGKGDDVYSYINSIGTAYENRSNAGKKPSGKLAKYAYMTDDEVADYNYLYQTKGKEEAEKYLEYMGPELDARRAAGVSQWNRELAEKAPVLSSVTSVPMNLASGIGLVDVGLQNIRNQVTGEYKPINYYSPAMDATVASTAIRGTMAQQLTDKYGTIQMDEKEHPLLSRIFNGKSWGDVYQLGMSMVDSAAAAGIGQATGLTAAGTALLGGSAGSQGVLDAVERGATDSQALTMGILNATFESLFEYVSLDHLLKGNTKNILKGFLKQGFIEGSEEWNTTLFNTIADVLVMAENSDYKTSVRDYMEQGYSEKEAERQAMFDIAVGMGWDFVGGAISGGLMDTGKQVIRDATYKSKFGKASGDIVAEAQEVAPGTALTQKAQERIDAGKSLTGHQIVNLLQQNEDAIRTGDMVTIRNAVADRLAQYGESQNIDRVADAITKQVAGEKLSGKEKALVENSAYGQRVLNEMNPENISDGGFNSDWAGQLDTTQINAEAYSQKLREAQAETQQEEPQQTERQEMTPEEIAVLSAWNSEAESSPANSTTVQPNLGDREALETLGVKTGSQLRAEVRKALTERQDVAQEVQQRTQAAQQTHETQETAQQAQGTPVTLEEESKAYGKQAKAFLRTYQQGQDVEKFSEAYRIAHEMGKSNVPYRVVQGLRSLDYLTDSQKDIAYRTGASAEKQERGGKKATWRRQGVVRAENGAKLSDLSKTFNVPQKQGYRILSDISKATGVDIVLYRSKGDAEGNITEAEGRFRRSENTIYIDVNSGIDNVNRAADFSQYTMLRTFNHEFTHFIEQNAAEEYRELRKLVFEAMQEKLDGQKSGVTVDDLIREKQDKYRQALGQEISYDEASREVVADAMTDILPDSHFMETLYNRNATLAEKLIGKLKDFIAKVRAYFDGLTTNTKAEAALLKEMRDGGLHYLERIVEAYDKAATAAVENYQGADKVLQENGIDVSEDGKSASMDAFSVRTMLNEEQKKSVVKALAERFDVTEEEAGGWLKAETSLASIILNPKYSMYLDYEADPAENAIKKNSDYPQGTVDFSTICRKRRDFTDVMNRIFRLYPNHVFQAEDLAKIRTIMQQEGMNVACGICYVEDRRQLDSIVAEDFLQALELYRNGSETRPDGKPFNQNQLRGLRYTDGDTYVPTVAELITLEGNNALKKKNPNMAEAWRRYNNARGMQSVRRLTNEAEYKRQILKYSKRTVLIKNSKGGLRIFSFSDMEMFHLLDVIQIITDASVKGLYLQGYTKVNEYAKAVKDTGMKLNRSLIPAGELGYHMEDGKPVLDFDTTEGIDIHAKDFFDNSSNPNIGNIVIGINDTQIRAAMVSEFIDQIIPFHTGQSEAVLREKKIDAWENYKDYQTDKDMETGKTAKHQVNIYTDVLQVLEREGAEITKRSFVEKYLEVCRERGLIPRFAQFLNQDAEGNYVYTEGYHKLLVDFKTFAQTEKGEYLPQKDVRPVFDEQYLTSILKDYVKEQSRRDRAMKKQMPRVIQRISNEVVQEGDVQLAIRDSEGRSLTEAQQDYFKDSKVRDAEGRLKVVYHGSGAVFTKFSADFMSQNGSSEGQGFYFTDYKPMAEGYSKKGGQLLEGYLDMKKPLSDSEVTLTYAEVRKLIKAIDPTGDDLVLNYDSKGGMGYPSREWYNRSVEDTLRATMSTSDSDSEILAELANGMGDPGAVLKAAREVLGYDGYIVEGKYDNATVYVAFDSSQFKNVDNQSPTADPDIRYSIRETAGKVMPDQTESQAQIRSSTLSDRDVLRIAAQMAKNSESRSLTDADRARLGIIEQKLGRIDEAEDQRQGFLEEKRAILAGREAKELSDAERAQLRKVQKNLDTVNGKIRRLNEDLLQTQEKKVVKALLKKARVVVERDAVQRSVVRLNEYKNRRSAAELRTSIKKTAKEFQQMLLHPTDTKYAPESLIQSCIDVATMLDTSGEREDTKAKAQYRSMMDALNTLKTQYDELKNNPDSDFRGEYDTNFAYMVEQLAKRLGGKPVRDLTLTELQDVHSVLRDIQTMLRNAKYQIGQAERITNYAVGESIIRDMEKIPERTAAERAMDTTSRLTISTLRNIRRLTMYNDNSQLVRLFDDLNDGIKKKNRFMMECDKLFERFLGKRFRRSAGLIKSYNVGTRTFKMTEMEAIQLVLTWEREAHGETSHLVKGGFIIPNHYLLKKGKFKDAFLKGTTYSHVQQSEIDAIQRTFDKWALDYKAAVKNEFFNGIAKNAINNTTLQLKGRAVALTTDYVSMEVDKNSVVTELEGVKFDATIEGMGMLKSVVKGASNPVVIRGVHSLVESHIERVGQLYGLAIPIRNFNKAYNVKTVDGTSSVRGAIGKTWSAADLEMIEQAISDLQTPRKRADVFDKMVRKATSSFVKAKLLSNISVTIKQAASYSTAGLYLSQKALSPYQTTVVGLFFSNKSKFAKKLFAEIDEHTAEHYIRRKGMSMQEISTIAKDNSKIVRGMDEHLPDAANPLKWIQNMDVATTAALWLATKKQVALDGMKTTDPGYWDAVTSLYEKVIEETQPMYDTLHRPEVQKTPNEIVRGVLMFRTQPLQNTGILYDAFGELNQAVKSKDAEWAKRARKKAAMAVGSQLSSLAVFAVMTLLAAAARNRLMRYLDDEDELTIQSIMLRVLGDMATNGAGLLIPIGGSELAGLVEKQSTGSSYGGEFSVSVVDMLNDYIKQFGKCWKDVADLNDGGIEKLPTDLRDLSMDTAGLFGIPAENVFNIIRGVVGNISDTFSDEPIQWATDNPDPNVSAIKAAFDNGHMDTAKDKIVELIAFKVKSGKTEKEAASSVRSSITSYYKPLYLKALRNGDKEEMRRIASIIKASGLYSEGADATLEKWASTTD